MLSSPTPLFLSAYPTRASNPDPFIVLWIRSLSFWLTDSIRFQSLCAFRSRPYFSRT
ncbi:unnamed protein product [Protopolystoma xenopodis]|uniref:Uncharacterized protein n=1 Tax=Protopolystoma xenopodis TaxID=117903 RepID=A0A3S5B3Q3_9PLAT|nr:unnamed protein product [Protopolystoma xenopodis]